MIPHLACLQPNAKKLLHQKMLTTNSLDAHDYFHEGEGGIGPVLSVSQDLQRLGLNFALLVWYFV
jgi:hypothetical protein